jgi:DNA-binding MarR family transcriptional regulator
MAGKIQEEIKQTKPFESLETEAHVALQRTASALMEGIFLLLKPFDLSPTQYNVLRILRGAEPDGLACRGISERMVTRDPDITRLLDRLEARALVTRSRDAKDRRVITTRITRNGLRLLRDLDDPLEEFNRRRLHRLNTEQLESLLALLELVRAKEE